MGTQALPARGGSRDRSSGDPGGPPARPAPRPGSPVPCPTPVSPGEVAGAPCPAHQPLLAPPTSCDSSTTTASPRPPLVLPRPRPPDQPPPIDPCLTPPPATPSPCRRGRPVAEPTLGPRRVTGTPRGRRGVEGGVSPHPWAARQGDTEVAAAGEHVCRGVPKGSLPPSRTGDHPGRGVPPVTPGDTAEAYRNTRDTRGDLQWCWCLWPPPAAPGETEMGGGHGEGGGTHTRRDRGRLPATVLLPRPVLSGVQPDEEAWRRRGGGHRLDGTPPRVLPPPPVSPTPRVSLSSQVARACSVSPSTLWTWQERKTLRPSSRSAWPSSSTAAPSGTGLGGDDNTASQVPRHVRVSPPSLGIPPIPVPGDTHTR